MLAIDEAAQEHSGRTNSTFENGNTREHRKGTTKCNGQAECYALWLRAKADKLKEKMFLLLHCHLHSEPQAPLKNVFFPT